MEPIKALDLSAWPARRLASALIASAIILNPMEILQRWIFLNVTATNQDDTRDEVTERAIIDTG
jgi:hypothetical protein